MRPLVVKILISAHLLCSLPGPKLASWIYVKTHINQFKGCIIDALIFLPLYRAWSFPGMVWLGLVWFGLAKIAKTALFRPHMGQNA